MPIIVLKMRIQILLILCFLCDCVDMEDVQQQCSNSTSAETLSISPSECRLCRQQ